MFGYLKNTIAKTVSNSLISLAGYVGGYSLVDPSDKHGVKNSHLLCKGKVICIPFYHGGHCCQVFLNFDRRNFEEVAYGVLFPDGKIIDITTGCPGLGGPQIHLESFGPECQLIWSDKLHKFPEHLDGLNEEDYYLVVAPMEDPEPSDSEFIEPSDSEESSSSDQPEESHSDAEEMHLSSSVETDDMTNFYAREVPDPDSDLIED